MQRSEDLPKGLLSIFPEELSGVQKTYNPDLSKQSYTFSVTCFHICPGWYQQHISKIIRPFAPGYSIFVPHRKNPQEKICPLNNLGDNRGTNVKTLKLYSVDYQ